MTQGGKENWTCRCNSRYLHERESLRPFENGNLAPAARKESDEHIAVDVLSRNGFYQVNLDFLRRGLMTRGQHMSDAGLLALEAGSDIQWP